MTEMKPSRTSLDTDIPKATFWTGLVVVLGSILLVLVFAEVVLRIWPSLITIPVLERFNSTLRLEVADRLSLSTKSSRRIIPSSERLDGGPDFYTYEPNRTIMMPVDEVDAKLGAIDAIKIDANGFCNPPDATERPTVDVILLGDSMTFCTAIAPEHTSSAALEALTGLKSYNLGIPGIGPYEYVELLRKFGLDRKPQYVVMNIYEWNDLRDADRYTAFRQQGVQGMDPDPLGGPFAQSYALAFVKAAVEELLRRVDRNTGQDFRYTIQGPGGRIPMNVANADRDEVRYARRLVSGELSPEILWPALDTFRALAAERGFVPIITLIPTAYTANDKTVVFNDAELGPIMREGRERTRNSLKSYADFNGVAFIDMKPAFEAANAAGTLTHYPANVHLTPDAQRIVASEIAKVIPR
jgi:hypothetical protein